MSNLAQPIASARSRRSGQTGFSLVELMIAILIGLFLTAGLLTLMSAMRRTYTSQTGQSQLQDNERIAMTLIADVVQSAGYYSSAAANSQSIALPVSGSFATAGQAVYGTGVYATAANTLAVRYQSNGLDNVINCMGAVSAAGTFVNGFSVDTSNAANTNGGTLMCTLGGGTATPLVSGITKMQVYYGVHSNTALNSYSVDAYLDGPTVNGANLWLSVISVKVTLTFTNPLYGSLPGQSKAANVPATLSFTRIINLMNKTGVTTG